MFKPIITKKVSRNISGNIKKLSSILLDERCQYMQTAGVTQNRQMKKTITGLAQEFEAYAGEIYFHLKVMGISERRSNKTDKIHQIGSTAAGGTIVDYNEEFIVSNCCSRENILVHAYRDILNEPFLSGELRQVLRQQLNGIMYGYTRLKLLKGTFSKKNSGKFSTIIDML